MKLNPFFPFIFAGILGTIIYFIAPILPPFLIGALLAWLSNPLVEAMTRRKIPRILAVLLMFLVFLILLLVFLLWVIPLITTQLTHLAHFIPNGIAFLQERVLPGLANFSAIDSNSLQKLLVDNWAKAGGAAGWVLKTTVQSGMTLLKWAGQTLLTIVVAFYLLYDWDRVLNSICAMLPRRRASTVISFAEECDAVLSAFFRGQLTVMLTLGIIYAVGLTLLGIQVGVLIGLVTGLLAIIPYLGVGVGLISASIVAWVQTGNWHAMLPVFVLFLIVQSLDAMFITPKLVGHRIGLHPLVVIFAILTGGTLFGFTGVLLALPAAAVIRVLLRFLNHHYRESFQ
ncbi:MAG: AI-2E family transporter [Gammaproteobacteria bacterium]|nr:AI-2E family transporter [Gammaproteobacteria bacterium]